MTKPKLPRGIRQRGKSFQVSVTVGGTRRTGTAKTLDEAKLLRSKLLVSLEEGEAKTARRQRRGMTLKEAADLTWDRHWKNSRSANNQWQNLKAVTRYFDMGQPVSAITQGDLYQWVADLERQGNKPNTVNRKLACLSRILSTAEEEGHLKGKPRFPRREIVPGRMRVMSDQEEADMLATLEQLGHHSTAEAVRCLIYTGLRVESELLSQVGRDVDLGARTIAVYGRTEDGSSNKGKVSRVVPISDKVFDIYRDRKRRYKEGQLWPDLSYQSLRRNWTEAKEVLGLGGDEQLVPHTCRHTFGSRLARRGATPWEIKGLMGHTNLNTTMIYIHLFAEHYRSAISLLDGADDKVVRLDAERAARFM
ncbi:tyrosine-type recombinase/integrase [Pyruvatibacter mobilis]|uniref:tyrosine-type recombinase/integrase n=1 Tax=Pyruvatibacter mobilis TaxID=1712261 RepID=UPI003BABEC11